MALQLPIELPPGYTRISDAGPMFDTTRVGRPGQWDINQNDPLAIWEFTVSYLRQEYLRDSEFDSNNPVAVLEANERFDKIYRFFLETGGCIGFLVDDPLDKTATSLGALGTVELVNGVYRLGKRYGQYWHPITRPKPGTVQLQGGAAGGTLNYTTGIVTGISSAGAWQGEFWRPMVFMNSKLSYEATPDGMIRAFSVPLQENIELDLDP